MTTDHPAGRPGSGVAARPAGRADTTLVWLLLAGSVIVPVLSLAEVAPAMRGPIVLAYVLLAPGTALARLLRVPDLVAGGVVAVAVSVSLAMVLTGLQAAAGWWEPQFVLVALAVLTAGLTIVPDRRRPAPAPASTSEA